MKGKLKGNEVNGEWIGITWTWKGNKGNGTKLKEYEQIKGNARTWTGILLKGKGFERKLTYERKSKGHERN